MINIVNRRLEKNKFSLIAEIGVNYYDVAKKLNIDLITAAKYMILSARNAGVHAVKFQSYKAETLASKFSPAYWDTSEESTNSQYELFKKFDSFGYKEYKELSLFCDKVGIEFSSTPFDFESADYLFELMNYYKISSSDLSNHPFIEYIAKKDKPVILSIGASNMDEIINSVKLIQKYNSHKVTLLHCVLEYPTPYEDANLYKIKTLKEKFKDCYVGYSDHTKPDASYNVLKAAYLLGAKVIEKHFTVDKLLKGNDHYHAMDDNDARKIIEEIAYLDKICGNGEIKCLDTEIKARENARRSIVAACDISAGTTIKRDMITFKRPGIGISPIYYEKVINMKTIRTINKDELIKFSDLE